jgi:hypothetical protein
MSHNIYTYCVSVYACDFSVSTARYVAERMFTPAVFECAFEVRRPDVRKKLTACLIQLANIARKRSF